LVKANGFSKQIMTSARPQI